MAGRRLLVAIVMVAAILHAISIGRSLLPAQDGLKFIRIARQFQAGFWTDVVRDSDQHPLYPALIALVEPAVSRLVGPGPDAWRIAGQAVAAAFALGLLVPVYLLARAMFDERIACLAAAIQALLPIPAEVGHDTLSDSLGVFACITCLAMGARAIRTGGWQPALAAGLTGGLGYLARPEVILAPLAIGVTWALVLACNGAWRSALARPAVPAWGLSFLVVMGAYGLTKGEVSEKLALRHAASLGSQRIMARPVPQWLPRGLDDRRWDFSPKEESEHVPIKGKGRALMRIAGDWWEELCWGFAIMAVWGLVRQRHILRVVRESLTDETGRTERLLITAFVALTVVALLRHSSTLGYLSGRHTLTLVALSAPWAAAGTFICLRGLGISFPWSRRTAWAACAVVSSVVIAVLVTYQLRPGHPSRWGHWAAGRWLAANTKPGEVVLDTRGWARFISDAPGYDYWHVRQALTDHHLAYVVVGNDELQARSPRAKTLKALLAYAATPVEEFPAYHDHRDIGVRIYRFRRPRSWEGMGL